MKPFYIKYDKSMSDQVDAHLSSAMLPTYNAGGGYAINQGKSPVDESVNEAEKPQVKIVTAVTTTYSNMTNGKQYEVVDGVTTEPRGMLGRTIIFKAPAMLPTYNAGGGYAINQGKSTVDEPVDEVPLPFKIVTAVTTTYSNMTNGKQYEVVKEDVGLGKYTVVNDDGFEVTLPNFQFSAW